MNYVKLIPSDTFFFRNHRDLETGKGTFLKGVFPPRLSTMYGALRSSYIYAHSDFDTYVKGLDEEVKEWMGTPQRIGRIHMKGFFMHDGTEAILPLPLDHQVIKEQHEVALPLRLVKDDTPSSNGQGYQLYGEKAEKSASAADAYVQASVWKHALLNRQAMPVHRISKWLERQSKIGIQLHRKRRTVKDGMLYNVEVQRFKAEYPNAGFVAVLQDAPSYEEVKSAKFGAFGRPWVVQQTKEPILDFNEQEKEAIVQQIQTSGVARMVFLTAAIWAHGNRPANYDASTNSFDFNGIKAEMLAIVTQRPVVTGGWDMVSNKPKIRKNALPAGTVVYVKVAPNDAAIFVDTVLNQQWTDESIHEGYGWVVCGAAQIKEEGSGK